MIKKSFNKTILGLILGAGLFASPLVQAADLKIAVIDVRQIVATSPEVKAIETKLKKEFSKKEQELISLDKSFKELVEKLQRNGAVMSATERAKLEKEAGDKQRDLQRLQAKFQEEGGNRQREEMQKFLDKVKKLVAQLAEKEKFDMVLVSDAVPYSSGKFEITEKIIRLLKA